MEFEPMLTPREKSPLPENFPEEDRTRDAVDSEPKHYLRAILAPSSFEIEMAQGVLLTGFSCLPLCDWSC